jgi:hypothetical protein
LEIIFRFIESKLRTLVLLKGTNLIGNNNPTLL